MNNDQEKTVTLTEGHTQSLCGAVNLLSAIFGVDANTLKLKYGLATLPEVLPCPQCGEVNYLHTYTDAMGVPGQYCSYKCFRASHRIQVVCDECEKSFTRRQSVVKHFIGKRGYQHCFCSRHCYAKWSARHYCLGFRRKGYRKRDEQKLLLLRDVGMEKMEISRRLGIPYITVWEYCKRREGL